MSKVFEYIMSIIYWLRIVASPLLIGVAIGAVIYFPSPNVTTLVIAITISATGLIVGILWATKIWKTKGTIGYISEIDATPDLDNFNDKKQI